MVYGVVVGVEGGWRPNWKSTPLRTSVLACSSGYQAWKHTKTAAECEWESNAFVQILVGIIWTARAQLIHP